jgi:hypothetical protein
MFQAMKTCRDINALGLDWQGVHQEIHFVDLNAARSHSTENGACLLSGLAVKSAAAAEIVDQYCFQPKINSHCSKPRKPACCIQEADAGAQRIEAVEQLEIEDDAGVWTVAGVGVVVPPKSDAAMRCVELFEKFRVIHDSRIGCGLDSREKPERPISRPPLGSVERRELAGPLTDRDLLLEGLPLRGELVVGALIFHPFEPIVLEGRAGVNRNKL